MLRIIDDTKLMALLTKQLEDHNIACDSCPCVDMDCTSSCQPCAKNIIDSLHVDMDAFSTDELSSALSILSIMYERTVEALDHRKQEEKKKDWDELTGTLSHYIQKYGNIWIDVGSSQDRISLGADFDDSITGHLAF